MTRKFLSLRQAERSYGICRHTLKAWLLADGLAFPDVPRGSTLLVPIFEIDAAIRRRGPQDLTAQFYADRKLAISRAHAATG